MAKDGQGDQGQLPSGQQAIRESVRSEYACMVLYLAQMRRFHSAMISLSSMILTKTIN